MTTRHLWALAVSVAALGFAAALALPVPQRQVALAAGLLVPVALLLHRRAPNLSLLLNAVTLGLALFLSAGIVDIALRESRRLDEAEHQAARISPMVPTMVPPVLEEPDLPAVLVLMQEIDRLDNAGAVSDHALPFVFDADLRRAFDGMRGRALANILQPHLVLWLEEKLRQGPETPERTMSLLIPYLYYGGAWSGPVEMNDIVAGIERELALSPEAGLDDSLTAELAENLADAAWSSLGSGADLDKLVVDRARSALHLHSETWLAYLLIRESVAAQGAPDLRLTDIAGPGAKDLFKHRSGQPPDTQVRGFYTHEGFHGAFLPALAALQDTMLTVRAVTDMSPAALTGKSAMREAQADLIGLYEADVISAWQGLLGDLRLRKAETPLELERQVRLLSSPDSPLDRIVRIVATETALTEPPVGNDLPAKAVATLADAAGVQGTGPLPGAAVEAYFAPFRAALAPDASGLSTLDLLRDAFQSLAVEITLGEMGLGGLTGADLPQDHPATLRLWSLVQTLPPPLPDWFLPPG